MPAADSFDFAEGGSAAEVAACVQKLKASSRKDALVKALKATAACLEAAPQEQEALGPACHELAELLVADGVLGNPDKEVQLYAAQAITHIFRTFAPDIPYEDDVLREVFALLFRVLARLGPPDAPSFDACLSLLQVFGAIKFYIPLLDLEDEPLLLQLFTGLLDAVTDANYEALEMPLLDTLGGALEECEEAGPPAALLELLLQYLVHPKKPAARRHAAAACEC